MQKTKTGFVGRITTSADARDAAYRVKLYVNDDRLQIVAVDGDDWSWDMTDVTISRASVDRFSLQLADEQLFFFPVDTRGFLTDVLERYSDAPIEPHRGWLLRRIEEAQAEGGVEPGYELDDNTTGNTAYSETRSGRRRHVHEWDEDSAVGVVTRRCIKCGQVSIDATGLKSSFESALATA